MVKRRENLRARARVVRARARERAFLMSKEAFLLRVRPHSGAFNGN
jgi:hypothetical protein